MLIVLLLFCTNQIPLGELRNDARDNLLGALIIAGEYIIPEVSPTLFSIQFVQNLFFS